ncbi:MAG TPA: CAP domain-containing protein [Polyangia bacterium]|jgi:hypothetical protein|nr:CAP domain-containing protein [Polyangia bacterium]
MLIPRGHFGLLCAFIAAVAGCGGGSNQGGGAAGATGSVDAAGSAGSTDAGSGGNAGAGTAGIGGTAGAGAAGKTGTAGSGAAGASAADVLEAARQACVDKINAFRATLNIAALTRWTAEETCADGQAKADSVSGTAHSAFGTCDEGAQDECPAWPSVDSIASGSSSCLDQMWAEGPGTDYSMHGHYINMSNPQYTKVACGYSTTSKGKVWAAQDFK